MSSYTVQAETGKVSTVLMRTDGRGSDDGKESIPSRRVAGIFREREQAVPLELVLEGVAADAEGQATGTRMEIHGGPY
jgi:hypothetical protein